MPFSASTCLTYPQGFLSTGAFNIYSNVDNYTTPFQVSIPLLTLTTCPYIMGNVPDNTTSIKIIDTGNKCCATIDLLSNDLCTTCELNFDSYQTNNIGRIVAGELTGSCENEITDYKIFWYGPDSTTNIAFTSGFGSEFQPYDLTHPLTGINSPTALSGEYIPVIDKIKLNGLDFSQTGGTGYIQAELECFNATTVNVSPYTCDNGTEVGDYTHRVNFAGASEGVTPLTLQSTFDLDLTTNYFAWKFNGESIPDSLKITFSGSSYTEPIILEYWTIGNDITSSNINLLTVPKSGKTPTINSYISKVTTLTGLTITANDYLILEVIPNQNNPQTNWDFYFTCLETFDCDLCFYDYLNSPYKIKTSSITGITGSCNSISVNFNLSGCTDNSIFNTDIYKYSRTFIEGVNATLNTTIFISSVNGLIYRQTPSLEFANNSCGGGYNEYVQRPICSPYNMGNTITFQKSNPSGPGTPGVIDLIFNNFNDFIAYKSSYDNILQYSGTPFNSSNTEYYRYFTLNIPSSTGNQICGDATTNTPYYIHFSSIVTTGQTSNSYSIKITMPTISNGLPPYNPCDIACQSTLDGIISTINNSSTGTTFNTLRTTNTGSRYQKPFSNVFVFIVNPPSSETSAAIQGVYYLNNNLNTTLPFSGSSSPYTSIPSLSALTCNNFTSKGDGYTSFQQVWLYDYSITLTDSNNIKSYTIKANPIVNGTRTVTNYPDTVVTVVNGSIVGIPNPLYTF